MKDKKTSPEQDLIYRIVEQWGNAVCPIEVMEQWVKEYAKAHPSESAGAKGIVGWVESIYRTPKDGHAAVLKIDGKVNIGLWNEQERAFIVGGHRFPPTLYYIEWLDESPTAAGSGKEEITDHEHEKEVMMQAFDKVRQIFESRSWIMQGRGSYPYNDDRYKEEVRYLYDEFDAVKKETWAQIKSKSFEYRNKIIEQYKKEDGKEEIDVDFVTQCMMDFARWYKTAKYTDLSNDAAEFLWDRMKEKDKRIKDDELGKEEAVAFQDWINERGYLFNPYKLEWQDVRQVEPVTICKTTSELYDIYKTKP